jgi:hypothetical protein
MSASLVRTKSHGRQLGLSVTVLWTRFFAPCIAVWLVLAAGPALSQTTADPPGRVGRLAAIDGSVSVFDLETGTWADGVRNRPLTTGDRVSTGQASGAILRLGSTTVRLAPTSEVEFLRLDDQRIRIQLHRGSVAVHLRAADLAAEMELGTDTAWLTPSRIGIYRLDLRDDTTFATAWRGGLQVVDARFDPIEPGQRVALWREGSTRGLQLRLAEPQDDAFSAQVLRETLVDEQQTQAAQVSMEMTGWEDLNRHGRWEEHPDHGPVWIPVSVGDDWAPYRQGRWTWLRPWGWTWVDEAPWGFAPFHYGRWVHWRGRWTWVPGRYEARPTFAPALVAWIDGPAAGVGIRWGGPNWSWLPLAPWDLFRPHYRASPAYHERVNPPEHRRRHPPSKDGRDRHDNQDVPGAVTVRAPVLLRPVETVPPREPDTARSGRETRRPAPPLPPVSLTPPPARQQPDPAETWRAGSRPVRGAGDRTQQLPVSPTKTPPVVPPTTPPMARPIAPPLTLSAQSPQTPQPRLVESPFRKRAPESPVVAPHVTPVRPSNPSPTAGPLPSRPQSNSPVQTATETRRVEPRPAQPPPPPAREKEREIGREEHKPRPSEGRGQAR